MAKKKNTEKEYVPKELHLDALEGDGPPGVMFNPLPLPPSSTIEPLSPHADQLDLGDDDYEPVFMGIDQSLNSTGICIIRGDNILHHEVYRFPRETFSYQPLDKMVEQYNRLRTLLEDFTPSVDYIAMEGPAYNARSRNMTSLAGVFYFLLYACRSYNDENPLIVPPCTLKKFATGRGTANKQAMEANLPHSLKMLFVKNYGVTTGRNDVVDAYYLAKAVQAHQRM